MKIIAISVFSFLLGSLCTYIYTSHMHEELFMLENIMHYKSAASFQVSYLHERPIDCDDKEMELQIRLANGAIHVYGNWLQKAREFRFLNNEGVEEYLAERTYFESALKSRVSEYTEKYKSQCKNI